MGGWVFLVGCRATWVPSPELSECRQLLWCRLEEGGMLMATRFPLTPSRLGFTHPSNAPGRSEVSHDHAHFSRENIKSPGSSPARTWKPKRQPRSK